MQSTDQAARSISFRSQAAPAMRVVGEAVTPLLDASLGATGYEVFESVGPEGAGPPPHSHPWDEGYVVLDGELAVTDWSAGLDHPDERVLTAGASAFVPAGVTHSFQTRSASCRFLIVTTPGAHAFFADAETTLQGDTDDLDALITVAKRNALSSPLF